MSFPESLYSPELQEVKKAPEIESDAINETLDKLKEAAPLAVPVELQAVLANGKPFSVAKMICSISKSSIIEQIREERPELVEQVEGSGCTQVGRQVAEGLVRNASTRIFSNPNQSIMELISNAIDATPGARASSAAKVGKFGFGAYSMFAFLYNAKNPNAKIVITTSNGTEKTVLMLQVKEDANDKSGYALYATIFHNDDFEDDSGTNISIFLGNPVGDEFSVHELEAYVQRFKFFPSSVRIMLGDIQVNQRANWKREGPSDVPKVEVTVKPRALQVRDRGKGMSLDTMFRVFLIPSISSKSADSSLSQQVAAPATINPEGIDFVHGYRNNQMSILVGGVAVVAREMSNQPQMNIIVRFPPQMPVTIGRDDILMTEAQAKRIAALMVRQLVGEYDPEKLSLGVLNLQPLREFARVYTNVSPSDHAVAFANAVEEELSQVVSSNEFFVIPSVTRPFLAKLERWYQYLELDNFAYLDGVSPYAGEAELCRRITKIIPDESRLETFNAGTVNVIVTPKTTKLRRWGQSIVEVPNSTQAMTVKRPTLVSLAKSVLDGLLILGEEKAEHSEDYENISLKALRMLFPRFLVHQDEPEWEGYFLDTVNFMNQLFGMDREFGPGNLREKVLQSQILGTWPHTSYYASAGLLSFVEAYGPSETSLCDDFAGMFERIRSKFITDLTDKKKILGIANYGGGGIFDMDTEFFKGNIGDGDDSVHWWADDVIADELKQIKDDRSDSELVETVMHPQKCFHTLWTTEKDKVNLTTIDVKEAEEWRETPAGRRYRNLFIDGWYAPFRMPVRVLHKDHLGLKRGTDYTRRFFQHLEDICKHGGVRKLDADWSNDIQIFNCGGLLLETLFMTLRDSAFAKSDDGARAFFHMCSMKARSGSELAVMLLAACALKDVWGYKKNAEFLVDVVNSFVEAMRLSFTDEEITAYFWHGNSWVHYGSSRYTAPLTFNKVHVVLEKEKRDATNGVIFHASQIFANIYQIRAESNTMFPLYRMPELPEHGQAAFDLGSLISHMFLVPYAGAATLSDAGQEGLPPLPLNITSIAINEGTSKEITSAMVTEMTQNSADAIRTSKDASNYARGIHIYVGYYKPGDENPHAVAVEDHYTELKEPAEEEEVKVPTSREGAAIVIEVVDPVGIPESAFPSLFIPYLSSKDPRKGETTGEMGNGLFTAYRDAELVVFRTRNPKSSGPLRIFDQPLRNRAGRVLTLSKSIRAPPDDGNAGTSITAFMRPPTNYNFISKLVQLQTYIRDRFSMLRDVPVFVNGKRINDREGMFLEFTLVSPCLKISFLADRKRSSQVLTKGIPYQYLLKLERDLELADWQSKILRTGVVIDLLKPVECYSPVQSRTSINLTETAYENIRRNLLAACWIRQATEAVDIIKKSGRKTTRLNSFLQELTSTKSFAQVAPDIKDAEKRFKNMYFNRSWAPQQALLMHFRAGDQDYSIAMLIHQARDEALKLPMRVDEGITESDYERVLIEELMPAPLKFIGKGPKKKINPKGPWQPYLKAVLATHWILNKSDATALENEDEEDEAKAAHKKKTNLIGVMVKEARVRFPHWEDVAPTVVTEYTSKVKKLLVAFIGVYAATMDELKLKEDRAPKLIVSCKIKATWKGRFLPESEKLEINLAALTRDEIDAFIKLIEDPGIPCSQIEDLVGGDKSKLPACLFGSQGTMVHELEHFRRNTAHGNGGDAYHDESDTIPDAGPLPYRECMREVHRRIDNHLKNLVKHVVWTYRKKHGIKNNPEDRPFVLLKPAKI